MSANMELVFAGIAAVLFIVGGVLPSPLRRKLLGHMFVRMRSRIDVSQVRSQESRNNSTDDSKSTSNSPSSQW